MCECYEFVNVMSAVADLPAFCVWIHKLKLCYTVIFIICSLSVLEIQLPIESSCKQCEQTCTISNGTATCSCLPGFYLSADKKHCKSRCLK